MLRTLLESIWLLAACTWLLGPDKRKSQKLYVYSLLRPEWLLHGHHTAKHCECVGGGGSPGRRMGAQLVRAAQLRSVMLVAGFRLCVPGISQIAHGTGKVFAMQAPKVVYICTARRTKTKSALNVCAHCHTVAVAAYGRAN